MKNETTIEPAQKTFKEKLFCTLWGLQGRNAFPHALRDMYISLLREQNPASTEILKKGEILALKNPEEVLNRVRPFDERLSLFSKLIERFDALSPKSVRILNMPKLASADVAKIKAFASKRYEVADSDPEWTVQEVQHPTSTRTRIVVSKRSLRILKAKFGQNELPTATWNELTSEVHEHFQSSASTIHEVQVSVSAPYKFQVALEFDWAEDTAELTTDLAEWDEETGKTRDRRNLATSALQFMADEMQLAASKTTFVEIAAKGTVRDPDLRKKLERQNNAGYLIVVRGGSYSILGNEQENPEDVKAHLSLFNLSKIQSAATEYYEEKGTFKGFIGAHMEFDRSRTKVQGRVFAGESPLDCTGVFLKVLPTDKPGTTKKKGSKLDGKIEAVSFEYQNDDGEWIIRTPNYSKEVRDAFLSELHNLSAKPSRPPRPKVRTAP